MLCNGTFVALKYCWRGNSDPSRRAKYYVDYFLIYCTQNWYVHQTTELRRFFPLYLDGRGFIFLILFNYGIKVVLRVIPREWREFTDHTKINMWNIQSENIIKE